MVPSEPARIRAHPVVFAAANLGLCAYMEHLLKADTGGHYLQLFLFLQASFCFLFTVVFHVQSLREILIKTSVFPVSGRQRFLFSVVCVLRKPLLFALWATSGLFLIVFYRHSPATAAFGIVLLSMVLLDVVLLASILSLISVRSAAAAGALFLAVALVIPLLTVVSTIFHAGGVLGAVPVVSWAAAGILGMQGGEPWAAWSNFLYLSAFMIACAIAGERAA
jgi:hypothetical protein